MKFGTLVHRLFRLSAVLATLLAGTASVSAQTTGSIRGRVTDGPTQRPLAGVQVSVPGTPARAQTSASGEYVLNGIAPGARTVRAELVGRSPSERTVTVVAGETATANFALTETATALDEIVVTGTAGQARRREVGNSIEAISSATIETLPARNAQEILQGRTPGVTVLSNSGQPGAGGTVRLRGNNSISQGNDPIFYVDGVRIFSGGSPTNVASRQFISPLNDINPEDIERVEVIKGAAATTLYGTEASGGVIQIFTKRGSSRAPQWTAEIGQGFHALGHVGPQEDPTGSFLNRCRGDDLYGIDFTPTRVRPDTVRFQDASCPADGNWLERGSIGRYSLSVRGGAEQMSYFLSGNYDDEHGVIASGNSRSGGFRGNFTFRPSRTLDITMNNSYARRNTQWVPDGNNASGFLLNVSRGPNTNFRGGTCDVTTVVCVLNGDILTTQNFTRNDHFTTGFTIAHNPGERLNNRLTLGYDYNAAQISNLNPVGFLRTPLGELFDEEWTRTLVSFDYAGSFRNEFGSNVTSTFSWGGQIFNDHRREIELLSRDFAGSAEPTITSGGRRQIDQDERLRVVNAGLFLQELIGVGDRLFVTAGLRVDGNSAFGEGFGLQPYPKLSASYVLSDHDFWPSAIETFKLRAAVGESGKAPGAFDAERTYTPIVADEAQPGVTPNQIGNPDLGPERTREYEAGFEANAFNGRLGVDFTAYRAVTREALIPVREPPSLGFSDPQLRNAGELRNQGIELRVDAGLLATRALDWRARLNLSTVNSEALDLGGQEISIGVRNFVKEGFPVPSYFGRKITNPDDIAEPLIEANTYIGPSYPTRIVGLGTTLTVVRDLSLDVLGEFQQGAYLANWVGYQNALRGVWRPCQDVQGKLFAATKDPGNAATILAGVTALERAKCAIDRTKQDADYWTQPSDFFKLRSVSLTYAVPTRFIPAGRTASLTLAGRNLFTSTDYDGIDPESTDSRDNRFGRREYYNLPPVRTFLASFRVSF